MTLINKKLNLINKATPVEFLPRLTEYLRGPDIYIKRDDEGGRGEGGNKLRKYERIIADAINSGCDTLILAGHYQSNAARLLVSSACRLGLKSIVVCKEMVSKQNVAFDKNGNALLMNLMGAEMESIESDDDYQEAMSNVAEKVIKKGGKPYIIPFGGSNLLGTLGYVDCSEEIIAQMNDMVGKTPDYIIVTSGTGGTQAGLVAGLLHKNIDTSVIGFSILHKQQQAKEIVTELANRALNHLNSDKVISDQVIIDDSYLGQGYGIVSDECIKASRLFARLEGMFLCPVYTAKTMAGLIDYVKAGKITKDKTVVFVHTGGTPLVYAYYDKLYEE